MGSRCKKSCISGGGGGGGGVPPPSHKKKPKYVIMIYTHVNMYIAFVTAPVMDVRDRDQV